MNFSQARETYLDLFLKQKAGSLSERAFHKEVSRLRVQGGDGSLWQLKEDGAGWLKWDGHAWRGGQSPEEEADAQETPGPKTLVEFFTVLLKGAWSEAVRRWKVFAIVFTVAYAINIYLMMGYRIPWWGALGQFFASLLEVQGSLLTRGVLWLFLPLALTALYHTMRKEGPTTLLKNLAATPGFISQCFAEAGEKALRVYLLSAALALLCCQVVGSRFLSLGLTLFFLISLSYRERSFLFLMARLSWSDYHRLRRLSPRGMEKSSVFLAFAAMAAGSLAYYIFSFIHAQLGYYVGAILVIAFVSLVFLINRPAAA